MLGGGSLRLRARPGRRLRHDQGGVLAGDSKDARINRHKGRREIRRLAPLDFFSRSADIGPGAIRAPSWTLWSGCEAWVSGSTRRHSPTAVRARQRARVATKDEARRL